MTDTTDSSAIRFARRVFTYAPIYGVIVLAPLIFAERIFATTGQPAVTHPEYLYGFVGAALMYQWQYWIIGRDPVRYRPMMPVAILAKFVFFSTIAILFAGRRTDAVVMAGASIDLLIGILFLIAWRRMPAA